MQLNVRWWTREVGWRLQVRSSMYLYMLRPRISAAGCPPRPDGMLRDGYE
jgi:hypothetical protein